MNKSDISAAITAHWKWVSRLQDVIDTASSAWDPAVVRVDDQCELGTWLKNNLATEIGETVVFSEIKQVHARFHQAAAHVLEEALQGRADQARVLMGETSEFRKLSAQLIVMLTSLRDAA